MRISIKTACWSACVLLAASRAIQDQEKSPQEVQKSCRNFAQEFCDCYVRKLNSGGDYGTAHKYKRGAFSPEALVLREFLLLPYQRKARRLVEHIKSTSTGTTKEFTMSESQ
jgi:hypothetical protein